MQSFDSCYRVGVVVWCFFLESDFIILVLTIGAIFVYFLDIVQLLFINLLDKEINFDLVLL